MITYIKKKRKPNYYTGETASTYVDKRKNQSGWPKEYEVVEQVISEYKPESVIDIPVGTGRFLPIYQKYNIPATGIDISPDMLKEAFKMNSKAEFKLGSIFEEEMKGFVVCIRLLNFFTEKEIIDILSKIDGYILFSLRHTHKEDIERVSIESGIEIIEEFTISKKKKDGSQFHIYLAKK